MIDTSGTLSSARLVELSPFPAKRWVLNLLNYRFNHLTRSGVHFMDSEKVKVAKREPDLSSSLF